MASLAQAVRTHHGSLAKTLSEHVRALQEGSAGSEALVAFLKGDLVPHARSEERHLYPLVDVLAREHGQATATMAVDHRFIAEYVGRIERAGQELAAAGESERPALLRKVRELALRLEAIVELHLAKEEQVYLPLIESQVDEASQSSVLQAVHNAYQEEKRMAEQQVLDVREVVPRERHTLIFDRFNGLRPGEAFVLVNDHDPRPLYYQFQAEHTGRFSWDYLEQGPQVWQVRIGRSQ